MLTKILISNLTKGTHYFQPSIFAIFQSQIKYYYTKDTDSNINSTENINNERGTNFAQGFYNHPYRKDHFKRHYQNKKYIKEKSESAPKAILSKEPEDQNGYGYYNWQDQKSYPQAVEDRYFLDDLICGFRALKAKKIKYNEDQMYFILYICMLFPQYESQIMEEFIPRFVQFCQQPGSQTKNPCYIRMLSSLCYDMFLKSNNNKYLQIVTSYLRKRIAHPQNLNSFSAICNNLTYNCYEEIGDLQIVYNSFEKLLHKEIRDKKYKLESQTIKMVMSIYQRLLFLDLSVKTLPFFSSLPEIYKQDEQSFNNLLEVLPEVFSFNFIGFVNEKEILKLNDKISTCTQFKSPKTKKLLRAYAQYLVLLHRIDFVTFRNLLDYI